MIGPLQSNDEALARRYRAMFESWQIVELDAAIAEGAARLRANLRLKLPDPYKQPARWLSMPMRSSLTTATSHV